MTTQSKVWWRPRARFTLRGLLVFITLLMLRGGYHTNRGRREFEALSFLHSRCSDTGFSQYPHSKREGIGDRIARCYVKVVQTVWREPYVTGANVFGPLTPDEVDALGKLPHLEQMVSGPVVPTHEERRAHLRSKTFGSRGKLPTGALPRILAEHSQLKYLDLQQWELSDEDCAAIGTHTQLEGVRLFGCQLSEAGLAEIAQLPRLRWLHFTHSNATGAKLAKIPGSQSLESVECQFTPVTSEFARFIGRSPKVSNLQYYDDESIDDDFIAALGPHPSLDAIYLGSNTTEASLELLPKMPLLKAVTIDSKNISQVAKDRLKKSVPALRVFP